MINNNRRAYISGLNPVPPFSNTSTLTTTGQMSQEAINDSSRINSYLNEHLPSNAHVQDKTPHYNYNIYTNRHLVDTIYSGMVEQDISTHSGLKLYEYNWYCLKKQVIELINICATAHLWGESNNKILEVVQDTLYVLSAKLDQTGLLSSDIKTMFGNVVEQRGRVGIVDPYHYESDSDDETNLANSQTQLYQSGIGLHATTAEAGPSRPVFPRITSLNESVSISSELSDAMSVENPFEQENSSLTIQNIAASQSTGLARRASIIGDNSNLFNNKFKYPLNNEAIDLFTMDTTVSVQELTNNLTRFLQINKKGQHKLNMPWAGKNYMGHKAKFFQILAERQHTDAWKALTKPIREAVNIIPCNFARINVNSKLLTLLRSIYLEQIKSNLIGNNSNLFNGKFKYPLNPASVELFTMDNTVSIRELLNSLTTFKHNTGDLKPKLNVVWPAGQYMGHKSRLFKLLAENQDNNAWKALTEDKQWAADVIHCAFSRVHLTDRLLELVAINVE